LRSQKSVYLADAHGLDHGRQAPDQTAIFGPAIFAHAFDVLPCPLRPFLVQRFKWHNSFLKALSFAKTHGLGSARRRAAEYCGGPPGCVAAAISVAPSYLSQHAQKFVLTPYIKGCLAAGFPQSRVPTLLLRRYQS